ncbi:MAG: glycosyl transferase [Acidimicrobiales bacterium]|nr:glycosyl transferase [Acidimicrobiales bacterium]
MGDYFQNGVITTLPNLSDRPAAELAADLRTWGGDTPITLIIPSLYSELDGPALDRMVEIIAGLDYLDQIIIGLDQATATQFERAKEFFARLPQRHHVLWNDGPRLRAVHERLAEAGLAPREFGKGRNVWYCLGLFHASAIGGVVGCHDADILTYDASLPARLFHPIAHPEHSYDFGKGYYFRATETTLNGRVTRLLITPLLRALRRVIGPNEFLDFVDSFRYPLAGEIAMTAEVAAAIRVPSNWGLEIGMLAEISQHVGPERVYQVDIADGYDHKHQSLSADDADRGLHRMSADIAETVFRDLAIDGVLLAPAAVQALQQDYERLSLRAIDQYEAVARLNGLSFDRDYELQAVKLFAQTLEQASGIFLDDPHDQPFSPSWGAVAEQMPEILEAIAAAVTDDGKS